jgi:hypothetical protein
MPRQTKSRLLVKSLSRISPLRFSEREALLEAQALVEKIESLTAEKREEYLQSLSPQQQMYFKRTFWGVKREACVNSLEFFAKYVRTRDEHQSGKLSIRPFPTRAEKPYVWAYLDMLQEEPLVAVEKSRQLMFTWATCLYLYWRAKYVENRLIFIQSKKEEDAANLVFNKEPFGARIAFMEYSLPDELKTIDWNRNASYGQLVFPDTYSKIWGVPEGGDIIRSYVASIVFSDEFAFQPEAEAAYKALRPTISGGGQFIAVSTARSGAFMRRLISQL